MGGSSSSFGKNYMHHGSATGGIITTSAQAKDAFKAAYKGKRNRGRGMGGFYGASVGAYKASVAPPPSGGMLGSNNEGLGG